ncbi:hypothetical protein BGZ93_005042 [Podila epicladia]|nr:hypothetical protein BGZ92_009734 [Podila epicladia]KAG0099957.1 hypothetical protein BGZ93_005042 [Podila epicladia]
MSGVVREVNTTNGSVGYRNVIQAMQEFSDYAVYLYINDDIDLNSCQLATYNYNQDLETHPRLTQRPDAHPGRALWDEPSSFAPEQRARTLQFTGVLGSVDVRSFCDAAYVPARISTELTGILQQFLEYNVILELGVGLALVAIESTEEWVDWNEGRGRGVSSRVTAQILGVWDEYVASG